MSQRTDDQGFITTLREIEARLKRLESTNNSVRKNDIRLGDEVVTTDSLHDRICLENLNSGAVTCFGDSDYGEIVWMIPSTAFITSVGPSWEAPFNIVIREVIILARTTAGADWTVQIHGQTYVLEGGEDRHIYFPADYVYGKEIVKFDVINGGEADPVNITVIVRWHRFDSPPVAPLTQPAIP